MRVLFYGGCHAAVLERLFRAAATGSHQFGSLQNFELIEAGTPFPYDRLPEYDVVVYSPIRNKDAWNTSHLVARCAELGIRTLSFSWLQWNGYFPHVMKLDRPPHIWGYRPLADRAAAGATFTQLVTAARDPEALDARNYVEWSFSALEEHEADVDVPIGPFVRQHYRMQRLFWTPDHPTLALYAYVQKQIARRLGIGLRWFVRHREPHPDALIILPGVVDALGLRFTGEEYRLAEWGEGIGLERFVTLTLDLFGQPRPARVAAS